MSVKIDKKLYFNAAEITRKLFSFQKSFYYWHLRQKKQTPNFVSKLGVLFASVVEAMAYQEMGENVKTITRKYQPDK